MWLDSEALTTHGHLDSRELSAKAARMHAFGEAIREQRREHKQDRHVRRGFRLLIKRLA